jgi:pimeloyl-ACP methyl ester carboxylesterase
MATDVIQFCDAHDLREFEIVGHSVGGKVAQTVALMAPHRVQGLVVIDIAPVPYNIEEQPWKSVSEIIETLHEIGSLEPTLPSTTNTSIKRHVDSLLKTKIPDPALRAFCLTNLDVQKAQWKVHLSAIRSQLDILAGFLEEEQQQELVQQLHDSYHGDAFFIHGGQSRFVRSSHLQSIAKYFPNHMLTTIKGAGHWVHAEAPEDTTALLQRFLDRNIQKTTSSSSTSSS